MTSLGATAVETRAPCAPPHHLRLPAPAGLDEDRRSRRLLANVVTGFLVVALGAASVITVVMCPPAQPLLVLLAPIALSTGLIVIALVRDRSASCMQRRAP